MKKIRFLWKSTCSTCRNARSFLRDELKVELDERDYAKTPLSRAELAELFAGHDPREYINPKSPAFKQLGLKGRELTTDEALDLMTREPNLIKRPLIISGKTRIAGFDREALRKAFG
ncbi:MAG TPA: ArsC/Spx/MgsR family protein [Candidatus Binataceae bacterium]|jgi:Spx/MgsR family transcriptional regulator|nr:ArsC/Spx/MgsR family protein [Candidatus Binataceae bacterium]